MRKSIVGMNELSVRDTTRRTAGSRRPTCQGAAGSKAPRRVNDEMDCGALQRSDLRTIVVPIDFTQVSRRALDCAVLMAIKLDCSITLVHVLPTTYGEGFVEASQRRRMRAKARRAAHLKLRSLAYSKRIADVPMSFIVADGPAEYEIVRIAHNLKAEMIVLGRQDRNPLSRLIFGSVTAAVIEAAHCPVLAVNDRNSSGALNYTRSTLGAPRTA